MNSWLNFEEMFCSFIEESLQVSLNPEFPSFQETLTLRIYYRPGLTI